MHKLLLVFSSLTVLALSPTVNANLCGSISPNYTDDDSYYEIELATKLTRKHRKTIEALIKDTKGKWKGKVVETECIGLEGNQRKKIRTSKFLADIKKGAGDSLYIDIDALNNSKKTSWQRQLKFFGDQNEHRIGKLKSNGFNATLEYRRPGSSGGRIHQEIIDKFEVSGNKIKLTRTGYIFKIFAYKQVYRFWK